MTAVCNVADYAKATRLLSATTLRCINSVLKKAHEVIYHTYDISII